MSPNETLILFDIDGTLIKGGNPAHLGGYSYAMKTVMGVNIDLNRLSTSGFTELQALYAYGKLYGLSRETIEPRIHELLLAIYHYFCEHAPSDMRGEVLPGIVPLLVRLKREQFLLGVLSGGMSAMSWKKLERVGLKQFFSVGAFGDESERRSELVNIALKKASTITGLPYGHNNTLMVGDTPTDIQSALDHKICILAIASWTHSVEELSRYHPNAVLRDAHDTELVLATIHNILSG